MIRKPEVEHLVIELGVVVRTATATRVHKERQF